MKKRLYLLFIVLLTAVCIPVHAKDNFYADDNISLKKDITSSSFVAGNNVEVTGKNDGISFVAGNNITVKNDRDYLFAAGNTINIDSVTTKDAFVAGSNITIDSSSIRDLYVAGQKIVLNSEVSGNAYIGGEEVEINSTIKGNIKIAAETITLGENAKIEGTLLYPKESKLTKTDNSIVTKEKTYKTEKTKKEDIIKDEIFSFVSSLASMILIGLLLLALNPKVFDKFTKPKKEISEILKISLIGFCSLIIVPIVGFILLLSTIGMGLSIICILLYGIMFYLSAIPTAYFLGNWLLKDKVKNNYLLLLISLSTLYILRIIPFVGGLVTFISLIFGLGIYINLIIDNTKKNVK